MWTDFDTLMSGNAVMAIFRNKSVDESLRLAEKAWDLGIDLVEIPIQTTDAIPALEAVVRAGRERGKPVGSGTITTVEQIHVSRRLGAAFTVAPGFNHEVVRTSIELDLPHLPGVASASEIQQAVGLGCRWVKAFPATSLGAAWFVAMKRGPFPAVSFVATGGIDATSAAEYLAAGASMVAVGSSLTDANQIELLAPLVRRPTSSRRISGSRRRVCAGG